MNNASSPTTSETDWARIDAMQDEDIDFSDLPEIIELTEAQIARSKVRFGGVENAQEAIESYLAYCQDENILIPQPQQLQVA